MRAALEALDVAGTAAVSDSVCDMGNGRGAGLVLREGGRSETGRGEIGIFHRLASSGSSSSESWYSSSNSFKLLRFCCHVCFCVGVLADNGDKARLVLEADRLEVGRNGDVDRDRRGWEGVKFPELSVCDESFLLGDRADKEPTDWGVRMLPLVWLLMGGSGLRFRGFGVAVKSRVVVAGLLLGSLAAGDRPVKPGRA